MDASKRCLKIYDGLKRWVMFVKTDRMPVVTDNRWTEKTDTKTITTHLK